MSLAFEVFFVHCVKRDQLVLEKPLSHPFTSAIGFVQCVMTNTCLFNTSSWATLSIEVTSDDFHVPVCADYSAERFVCPLDLMIWVATVWHVRADQSYRWFVDRYRCCNDTFTCAFHPIDLASPPAVQDDRDTVFVKEFARLHNNMSLVRLPYFFVWPPCLRNQYHVPLCAFCFSKQLVESLTRTH